MAARLPSRPLGYESTAFNYRYLDTNKNPLELMNEYYSGPKPHLRPGQWIWNTYGKDSTPNPALFYTGKHYDDTYRILADEYYREVDENSSYA